MIKKLCIFLGVVFCAIHANAQYLDSTFGTYGIVNTTFVNGSAEHCAAIVRQPDNKIIAGGYSQPPGGIGQFVLARYDTSGLLDNSFGTGGKIMVPNSGIDNRLNGVALQSDGKILAVGTALTAPFSPWSTLLVRYNANGTIDNGFGTNGRVTTQVGTKCDAYKILIQPDGKILLCGTQYDDSYYILVRYNANGTIDNSFGTNGIVQFGEFGTGVSMALQPDGKILVSGEFWGTVVLNGPHSGVARHNADGTKDLSFGMNGVCYLAAPGAVQGDNMWGGHDLKVLPNGKILVSVFYNSASIAQRPAIVRLTSSGQKDLSFGVNGFATTSHMSFNAKAEKMAIQQDGKILLVGSIQSSGKDSFYVSRFDTSGAPDITFGNAGRMSVRLDANGDNANDVLLQPNGKFIVGGAQGVGAAGKRFSLMRYRYAPQGPNKLNEITVANSVIVFPNPATDELHINMDDLKSAKIVIYDMAGRVVRNKMLPSPDGRVDVRGLAPGTYVVRVREKDFEKQQVFEKR
ncbi:MAG TPA: T9SS type A sorting domain-containing protein [Flavipsychrobacter sp.]|nr:T9SS type A sorting domain-containing protein [Flavipsychrobacter sp.]